MNRLSAYDQLMLSKIKAPKVKKCENCNKLCSKDCGRMMYEKISSSGGRWKKVPDDRCTEGT